MTPCNTPKNYKKFARDKTNIKGNQLVTEFAQMVDTCGIDNPSDSEIAWSNSHQIVQHKKTMAWLTKTLQASPVHHQYYRPAGSDDIPSDYSPSSGTDSDSDAGGDCGTSSDNSNTGDTGGVWVHGRLRSSTRMRMLQDTKATICKNTDNANVTIWMEEHLTMRHISWSPSFVREIHNRTYEWLRACLMYNPKSPCCQNPPQAGTSLAPFGVMSDLLKNRGLKHLRLYAWVDNISTLRHLRLLLEGGCKSCTHDTQQDNMPGCGHFNIDFRTCCL